MKSTARLVCPTIAAHPRPLTGDAAAVGCSRLMGRTDDEENIAMTTAREVELALAS